MKIKEIVYVALFTALIAVGAFIRIPIPVMPFTLQTLFVILGALLIGPKLASISCIVYMIMGLIGLPIFTQGGGFDYVLRPTFGYIISFGIGAFVVGIMTKKPNTSFKKMLGASLIGIAIIYVIGIIYYLLITKLYLHQAVTAKTVYLSLFLLLIPGDFVSCIVACLLAKRLRPILKLNISQPAARNMREKTDLDAPSTENEINITITENDIETDNNTSNANISAKGNDAVK